MSNRPQSFGMYSMIIHLTCKECGGEYTFECDDPDPSVGITFPQCSLIDGRTCTCELTDKEIYELETDAGYACLEPYERDY